MCVHLSNADVYLKQLNAADKNRSCRDACIEAAAASAAARKQLITRAHPPPVG